MVGDTPASDIRGANRVGITSVLVDTGVSTSDLSNLAPEETPSYRMHSLSL